jgi:hypothetical protein
MSAPIAHTPNGRSPTRWSPRTRCATVCLVATLGLAGAFASPALGATSSLPERRQGWLAVGQQLETNLGWPAWPIGALAAAVALAAWLIPGTRRRRGRAPHVLPVRSDSSGHEAVLTAERASGRRWPCSTRVSESAKRAARAPASSSTLGSTKPKARKRGDS